MNQSLEIRQHFMQLKIKNDKKILNHNYKDTNQTLLIHWKQCVIMLLINITNAVYSATK